MNRLVPTDNIDDAQPTHTQAHAVTHVESLIVRATMDDRIAHKTDGFYILPCTEFSTCDARNSAHKQLSVGSTAD